MNYVLVIIVAAAVTILALILFFVRAVSKLKSKLKEANNIYAELIIKRDQQSYFLGTVDEITFSLLGMPDNDIEQFNQYLLRGIQTISVYTEITAIKVCQNIGEDRYRILMDWSDGKIRPHLENELSYNKIRGWREILSKDENINLTEKDFTDEIKNYFADLGISPKSILLVPVYFQEKFWGFVWYDDYVSAELFEDRRATFLKSMALMLVSAVHRKTQTELIQESVERMKLVLNSMPIICFIRDERDDVIFANPKCLEFFGLDSLDELKLMYNQTFPRYQHDGLSSLEKLQAYSSITFNDGSCHYQWLTKNPKTGVETPVEVDLVRVVLLNEYVIACYMRDVSDQQNLIEEIEHRGHLLYTVNTAANVLLQSETHEFEPALFRSLSMFAMAVDVERVFVWEYRNEIESINSFYQIYEWVGSDTSFMRQNVKIEYDSDTGQLMARLMRNLCISGLTSELPPHLKIGLKLEDSLSYLFIPIFLRSKLWGVIGFADIEEERQFSPNDESILRSGGLLIANALLRNEMTHSLMATSERLQIALNEAQAASHAKSSFLSTMSHEMRTPMNAIIGMSSIGKSAANIEKKDYSFEKIETASQHLLGVINDVLDMSKIEAGMISLSNETFNVYNTINKVVSVMTIPLEKKNQHFEVVIDPSIPTEIVSDNHRLTQVLTNLLSNAVKFTPNNKNIRLEAQLLKLSDSRCQLRFEVIDEGIGISAEQQKILFQSFVQAEASTSRTYGGTGLGLAISKHIVELLGGTIWIESELGKGAKFIFTMWAGLSAELTNIVTPDTVTEVISGDIKYGDKTILLVEDVEINREILITMFEENDLNIVCAENGSIALDAFVNDPEAFDLILMDIHMPVMDGYEATMRIRSHDHPRAKTVPIVAMTANVFREDIEKCLNYGMNDHLGKPLDYNKVKEALRKYLR